MQPRVVSVGNLVSGSATKIAASQTPAAAGALALNGSGSSAVANNICASQTTSGATPLVLNGALSRTSFGGVVMAWLSQVINSVNYPVMPIYITSAGDDSGITFKVIGLDINNAAQSETLHGTNTSVVGSAKQYARILSITPSGATSASGVTVGTMPPVVLDTGRNVIFTSAGNDSGITITITGYDWSGFPISETLAGGNVAAATTVLDYKVVTGALISGATASTIEIGTNGVAGSPWIQLDTWAHGSVEIQCDITGSPNYTVESTNDDPNSFQNPVPRALVSWDSAAIGLSNKTTEEMAALTWAPAYLRVVFNSGTGSVQLTAIQHGSAPY